MMETEVFTTLVFKPIMNMTDNPRRHKSFKSVRHGNIPEAKTTRQ
jgi:hypothetical protein